MKRVNLQGADDEPWMGSIEARQRATYRLGRTVDIGNEVGWTAYFKRLVLVYRRPESGEIRCDSFFPCSMMQALPIASAQVVSLNSLRGRPFFDLYAWGLIFRTAVGFLEQGVPRKFILRYLGELEVAEM